MQEIVRLFYSITSSSLFFLCQASVCALVSTILCYNTAEVLAIVYLDAEVYMGNRHLCQKQLSQKICISINCPLFFPEYSYSQEKYFHILPLKE